MGYNKSFGTQFQIGSAALSGSPTYTTIAQVKSIGDWETEKEMADVTHHSSTNGWREKFPNGIGSVSDIDITIAYDASEATHDNAAGGLMHAHLNETKLAYKIIFPDSGSTTWTFEAYVSKIGTPIDTGEAELQQTVTFMITGEPTLS